jgi:hypothetical protein
MGYTVHIVTHNLIKGTPMATFTALKNSLRGRKGTPIEVHGNDVDTLHRLGVIDKAQHQQATHTKKAEVAAPKGKGNANQAADEAAELLKLAGGQ